MAKPLTDKELLEGRMSYLGRGLMTPGRLLATIDKQAARIKELEAENKALLADDVEYAQTSRGQLLKKIAALEFDNKAMRSELDWLEGK